MLNTNSNPTGPTRINYLWIVLFFSLPSSYCPQSVAIFNLCTLYLNRSPPALLAHNTVHLGVIHPRPLPSSAACLFSPRRVPASTAVPHPFALLLLPSACTQFPDILRRFACPGPSVSLVSFFVLPCDSYLPGILWCLDSQMGVHFCARERVQDASTPWQLLAPIPTPRYLYTSGTSGYPPPCVVLIPSSS